VAQPIKLLEHVRAVFGVERFPGTSKAQGVLDTILVTREGLVSLVFVREIVHDLIVPCNDRDSDQGLAPSRRQSLVSMYGCLGHVVLLRYREYRMARVETRDHSAMRATWGAGTTMRARRQVAAPGE
jgi:hypothetical protein